MLSGKTCRLHHAVAPPGFLGGLFQTPFYYLGRLFQTRLYHLHPCRCASMQAGLRRNDGAETGLFRRYSDDNHSRAGPFPLPGSPVMGGPT